MTPQQIKDAAPEGATHYSDTYIGYILYYKDDVYALWLHTKKGKWVHSKYINSKNLKPL